MAYRARGYPVSFQRGSGFVGICYAQEVVDA